MAAPSPPLPPVTNARIADFIHSRNRLPASNTTEARPLEQGAASVRKTNSYSAVKLIAGHSA